MILPERVLGRPGAHWITSGAAIGVDASGRTAIDWGVYGVPETFLVGRDGRILYKHVGPFTPQSMQGDLMPAIEKALAAGNSASGG